MGNSLAWFSSAQQEDFPLISEHITFNQCLGIQPNSPITLIRVSADPKSDFLALELEFDEPNSKIKKSIRIEYKPRPPNGCTVEWYQDRTFKEKILVDQTSSEALYENLDLVLRHQKSILEVFEVNIPNPKFYEPRIIMDDQKPIAVELIDNIKRSLEFRRHQFPVKNLILKESGGSQLLKILKFLDSNFLEGLEVSDPRKAYDSYKLPNVVILDQWKKSKKLKIDNFKIRVPIDQIKHFDEVYLDYWEFLLKDLIYLKEEFLTSTTKTHWKLIFPDFTDNSDLQIALINNFGTPFHVESSFLSPITRIFSNSQPSEEGRKWFFGFDGSPEILEIHATSKFISLCRIEKKDVPEEGKKFIQFSW